jgi:hypothetical protein
MLLVNNIKKNRNKNLFFFLERGEIYLKELFIEKVIDKTIYFLDNNQRIMQMY